MVRGSSSELEDLYKLLHFPEELALHLADSEERLFYQVPPIDYLRQVTLDLGAPPANSTANVSSATAPSGNTGQQDQQTSTTNQPTSVNTLIQRFNEVIYPPYSFWVLINSLIFGYYQEIFNRSEFKFLFYGLTLHGQYYFWLVTVKDLGITYIYKVIFIVKLFTSYKLFTLNPLINLKHTVVMKLLASIQRRKAFLIQT